MNAQGTDTQADYGKAHEVTIIVNGRERTVEEKEVSFEEAVELAFPGSPTGPRRCPRRTRAPSA